jgi:DNA replication protein DnaC
MDDLASYRATPHVHDQLLSILANRYDNFRKTIVTSNVSLAEIGRWLDPRLADRLREGLVLESGRESRRPTGNEEPDHAE